MRSFVAVVVAVAVATAFVVLRYVWDVEESCAEWSAVDQPALIDTDQSPFVVTDTRIYQLGHHIQIFDRSAGWGGARLVRSVRPPGYIGAASLGAVTVSDDASETIVWMTQFHAKVMQRLVLPKDVTADISAMTVVGNGALHPSATAGIDGQAAKLWSLEGIAYRAQHVYAPTEHAGPSPGKIVVANTVAPFTTRAFDAPCKSRAVAANGGNRLYLVCYRTSADVFVVDLSPTTAFPTGAWRKVARVSTDWPPPHSATLIGPDDQPTLFTAGLMQNLVAVQLSSDLKSATVDAVTASNADNVPLVTYLTAHGRNVFAGRREFSTVALRCDYVLDDGRCGRQAFVEEPQVRGASEYEQVLVRGNTAYRFGGTVRSFRRDDPSKPFTFDRQVIPSGYVTDIPYPGAPSLEFTEGAVWLPGTAKPTAWVSASSASRVLQIELDSTVPDGMIISLVAGNGSTVPSIGGTPVAGAAAQLTYVSQLALAGDAYAFFGPGLLPKTGPSAFTRIARAKPHNVEVFDHPCNFRAIAAHNFILYIVCFQTGDVPIMALPTVNWRPTGHATVLHRFQWSWPPTQSMAITGGSVLWIARWGGTLTKVTLSSLTTVASVDNVPTGHSVRSVAANEGGLWVGSLSNPFEYRCLPASTTPASPASPAPATAPATLRTIIIAVAVGGLLFFLLSSTLL